MFGCDRYGYVPDIITTAKGLTSAVVPMGAMIVADHVAEPFMRDDASFEHGFTFGGHPVAAAVALANIDLLEREELCAHVRAHEGAFRAMLESLRDIEIVGDVRGAGYFHAIELVKDRATKETLRRRRVRGAAARLPLRRAVSPRPDLPHRRSRRPGPHARPAARSPDRSSSRRWRRSCDRC